MICQWHSSFLLSFAICPLCSFYQLAVAVVIVVRITRHPVDERRLTVIYFPCFFQTSRMLEKCKTLFSYLIFFIPQTNILKYVAVFNNIAFVLIFINQTNMTLH